MDISHMVLLFLHELLLPLNKLLYTILIVIARLH